jgi:membrane protein implicated in regulation of membrane protease activity
VRLSRPRVLLRAALLATGGAFMSWKALLAHRGARQAASADAALLERFALVWALVAALALATAAVALLALRRRPRRHTLHLGDRRPGAGPPP